NVGSGGIVGMDDDYSLSARRGRFVERIEIDLPSVIVDERVRDEFDIGEIGEKFEQRIARLRHENLVVRIAEQTEDVGIGFAGAGGQNESFGIEIENAVRLVIVPTNGVASFEQASRLRVVTDGVGIHQ